MLKSIGIVRKVDNLGRIVIPMELRQKLQIWEADPLEIFIDGDKIILRKYEPACVFCGNAERLTAFHGKNVCLTCIDTLNKTPL